MAFLPAIVVAAVGRVVRSARYCVVRRCPRHHGLHCWPLRGRERAFNRTPLIGRSRHNLACIVPVNNNKNLFNLMNYESKCDRIYINLCAFLSIVCRVRSRGRFIFYRAVS